MSSDTFQNISIIPVNGSVTYGEAIKFSKEEEWKRPMKKELDSIEKGNTLTAAELLLKENTI